MNKKNLTYFRKLLENELQDLSAGMDCNLDGLHRSEADAPDLIDRAAHLVDRNLSQNICDRKNSRLSKVERALQDLEAGMYGICQSCGEDIAVNRLKANPVARQCISCKAETEILERQLGR